MKTVYDWNGRPNNQVKPEYYQTWADYHNTYCELMKNAGINIYSISTGNEPMIARINNLFISTVWDAENQSKWFAENLVPTLRRGLCSNVKFHVYDDSRKDLVTSIKGYSTGNPYAMNEASQIGIHGYFDNLTTDILEEVFALYPNKQIIMTEMTFETRGVVEGIVEGAVEGVLNGDWGRADKLFGILMENFKHHVCGYIDWNLMLNSTGGPRYFSSYTCGSYINANEDFTQISKQPTFYAQAHFSKFIPPGSRRIKASTLGKQHPELHSIAFSRPDKKITVVLHNNSTAEAITVNVVDQLKGEVKLTLKPKSINTLVYSTRKCKKGKCGSKKKSKR